MSNLLDSVLAELHSPQRTKSIQQIAEEADVSYFTIQKWMRKNKRTRNPQIESVQKLADYFAQEKEQAPRDRRRAS